MIWMNRAVKQLLGKIRKVHTLFHKYPIAKTLYGSTINRHGALISTFAQTRKIETLNFQHGVFADISHLPVNADLNLVWGESHQDFLLSHGVAANKIQIVTPFFPKSIGSSSTSSVAATQKLLGQSSPINILVALQPLEYSFNKKMIQNIEITANKFPGKLLLKYKLHPDQDSKAYSPLFSSPHSQLYAHGDVSSHHLIMQSDLLITAFSAMAFEALVENVPVAFYSKPREFYYLEGKVPFVYEEDELYELFSTIVNDSTFLTKLSAQMSLKDDIKANELSDFSVIDQALN